jgi:periplasmic divalent cation tolerance protein
VPQNNAIIVLCTASTEKEALAIAQQLVQREEAACVNMVPMIRSIYRWKGRIWNEAEQLLIVKTTKATLADVIRTIKELHSYELPEILALPVEDGDDNALRWICDSVKGGRENADTP